MIWANNISPNFILKEVLEILCRKVNMAKSEPKLPPKKEINKSVNSEILLLFCLAFSLSKPKSKKAITEIIIKYSTIFINKKEKKIK